MIRITVSGCETILLGCFKMDGYKNGHLAEWMLWTKDYLPVNNAPEHHPHKMDVLPKTFLQTLLASKWLVQHSSMPPK